MIGVLFIAYFFPPTGGAGVQRAAKFAQYLPGEGFLPTVITGPTSLDDHWAPEDQSLLQLIPAQVSIHRVPGPLPAAGGRWRGRLERLLLRPSAFSRWWAGSAAGLGEQVVGTEQLILATMSPFESGDAARRLSDWLGIPWVADLRDPWALDEMQVYPSALHRRVDRRRMARLLSSASAIVMNTPESAKALRTELPLLRHKHVEVIPNGFDASDFAEAGDARPRETFRIVHTGYLHADAGTRWLQRALRGTRSNVDIVTRSHAMLLEALDRWSRRRPQVSGHVELVLAGRTTERDRVLVVESPAGSLVRLPGYVSHGESVRLVKGADLLFLPMHNLRPPDRSRIVPGKTYEYIASGRPILAAVPDGDARDFLTQSGTALLCRPDDVEAMIRILDRTYDDWLAESTTTQPNAAFVAGFERRHLTHRLAKCLRRVLSNAERHAVPVAGASPGDRTAPLPAASSH